ncbi:hypothetical protein GGS26DRAFT_570791 [Hypomontagnella submonticulosa]|nr:hypothetical protein GGS26DRAFT_570791 [Hypomontagnella submonticulosa]
MSVANIIGEAFGTPMVFWVPERYITRSIIWDSRGLLAGRDEIFRIPSWSWASSLGVVGYRWIHGPVRTSEEEWPALNTEERWSLARIYWKHRRYSIQNRASPVQDIPKKMPRRV